MEIKELIEFFKALEQMPKTDTSEWRCVYGQPGIEWIPVSERLPSENGQYLVTQIAYGCKGVRIVYYGTKLSDADKFEFRGKNYSGWYDYDSEYGYYEVDDIIAWMPLPEIYKESEVSE